MAVLFWIVAAASVGLAVLAMIPSVVILSPIYTGMRLAPFWILAANLWWIMALLAPLVWWRGQGRIWRGAAVSLGMVCALVGGFYGLRQMRLAAIEQPFLTTPGALVGDAAKIELVEVVVSAELVLGRVDKRDSHVGLIVIQAGICDGDQLGTRPDVGRGVGVS